MAHIGRRFRGFVMCTCAAAVMGWPTPAIGDQNPSSLSVEEPSAPDFMFARPRVAFAVRGNWIFASAGSDIYDFVTDILTIERSSFNAPAISGEISFNINPRFDVSLGLEYSKQSIDSEYRDQVEQLPNGTMIPIVQTTSLKHSNFYVSARFALLPRGRRISQFAWIPSSFVPYVGASAGISTPNF